MPAATANKVWAYEFNPTAIMSQADRQAAARAEWEGFIAAMQSGEQFECDEAMYFYWLEVLPPAFMGKRVSWPDGQTVLANFGFVEGADYITAFWKSGERFFGRRTNMLSRGN